MFRTLGFPVAVVVAAFLFGGCASTPSYEDAFSAGQQVHGSMESIPAPMARTWAEAMGLLAQQGFIVQQADDKSHIILMSRELRDQKDKDFSYTITATLTFVPLSEEITRVMVAANQSTEMHRKEYIWWHLLWIIPIVPIGTNYTTVVVNRDTVRSPQFYHDFFDGLLKSVGEAKEGDAMPIGAEKSTPAAVKPAPAAALAVLPDDKKSAAPAVK